MYSVYKRRVCSELNCSNFEPILDCICIRQQWHGWNSSGQANRATKKAGGEFVMNQSMKENDQSIIWQNTSRNLVI